MKYPIILLLVLSSLSLRAQQAGQNALRELYHELLHPSDLLLNGREYIYYFNPRLSSPLLPEDPVPSASVIIRGTEYQNVMLMYDTYKDLVVYYNPHQNFSLMYDTSKDLVVYYNPNEPIDNMINTVSITRHIIEEFTLQLPSGQARFRYFEIPEGQEGILSSGFYELVSEGACMCIIDHGAVKRIQEGIVAYQYTMARYIINSGTIYKITGKKSLLKALSDQTVEVNAYLKRTKLGVRSADKEELRGVLDYYTSLKQTRD